MRSRYWQIPLALAALVWLALGVGPLAPLEGDGAAIAQGAYVLAQEGSSAVGQVYRFEMQTGTYLPLVWLHQAFGLETFQSFAILSALAALATILLAALWVSRRTTVPFAGCVLLMLLLQETWTSAYYPNSNVLAAAVVLVAINLLSEARKPGRLILGGVVFGLAVWTRFDTVLLAPAVVLLLPHDSTPATLRRVGLVGLVAGATALLSILASGGRLGALLGIYAHHQQAIGSWGLAAKSGLAFFSAVVAFLMAIGLLRTFRQARRELLLVLVAALPFLLLLRSSLTTPKYLLYLAPFVALLMAHGVLLVQQSLGRRRQLLVATALGLFVLQYPLGLQLHYQDGFHPPVFPTWLRLGSIPLQRGSLRGATLVVGAGATMSTHDSIRMSSGIAWANLTWRHHKQEMACCLEALERFLRETPGTVGLYVEEPDEIRYLAEAVLVRQGYRRLEGAPTGRIALWRKGNQEVEVFCAQAGLELARQRAATMPLVTVLMWHDRLPSELEAAFPQSACLTPGQTSQLAFQLRP